jgi:hypothetical protein
MRARPPFRRRQFLKRLVSGACIALGLAAWSDPAAAYRPFDGTDAAVAAPGEVEIELQPAGRLRDESSTSLIAPATVFTVIMDSARDGRPCWRARVKRRCHLQDLPA